MGRGRVDGQNILPCRDFLLWLLKLPGVKYIRSKTYGQISKVLLSQQIGKL